MAHLASIVAALVPAILLFLLARFGDKRREPWHIVTTTFVLGGVGALATSWLIRKAALWTALDIRSDMVGNRGALLFIFAFIAPVREFAKVARHPAAACASWRRRRSRAGWRHLVAPRHRAHRPRDPDVPWQRCPVTPVASF